MPDPISDRLRYHEDNVADGQNLFSVLRAANVRLLRTASGAGYERTARHEERGE